MDIKTKILLVIEAITILVALVILNGDDVLAMVIVSLILIVEIAIFIKLEHVIDELKEE